MRKILPLFLISIASTVALAQVGIGTTSPNAHAVLDLRSPNNNQGLLIPSLSTVQRNASSLTGSLTTQDNGLLVYDSDDKKFYYWMDTIWQPVLSGAVSGVGTVTNVDTGTGLSGGPITLSGTISLANTSVITGTYGSPTSVGQFTVDAQGRITSASSVGITGVSPTGAAGGDLGGTFPNPAVTSLHGNAVAPTVPTSNQILKWNGSAWAPAADANSGGTVTSIATSTGLTGGPITGTGTISLANTTVTPATYGDATHVAQILVDAQGRITNASSVTITGAAPTGAAGGDLTGSYPNPTLATNAVTVAKVAAGDYSSKINAGTYSVNITGNASTATNFSGLLAGDVTGTQAATLVTKLQGSAVSSTAPVTNQILKWNGTSWLPSTDANSGGTVTSVTTSARLTGGPITTTGSLDLATSGVAAATYGSATQVSQIAVDAYGRVTSASNVTITGAAPTGAASGDLTGNYPAPTVAATSGNNLVAAVNNAATTSTINTNRLNTSVVLDTESPVGGDIGGNFGAGLQLNAGSVTTAEILDGTIATADLAASAVTDAKLASGITVSKLNASATNGQVLTTVAGATAWATPNAGTVTSVATGTGLTGGPITGAGTITLANTAVAPATYGDATHVAQILVDAQGRITNASSVTITGAAPTGAAGGDLTGNYPNPTITTNAVTAAKIAAGDYSSKINTGTYSIAISGNAATATTATNFSGTLAGDVTGTQGATSVTKLQGSAVSATAPTANQVLKWNGTSWLPSPDANSGGTVTSIATSTRLTGGPITTTGTLDLATSGVTAATYGSATQVSQIAVDAYGRVTSASNVTITGAAPTGAASGDLTGNYPGPTIAPSSGNNLVTAINNAGTTLTLNTNRLNASVVLDSESPVGGDIGGNFSAGLQLNASSVTTTEILDGTIAPADIANTAVTDAKIASGITVSKLTPSATNGQVLTTVAGATAWATPASGTVTSVATGTGLTGGPITAAGTVSLANTAVTPGTYGTATQVPQIIVDAQGRLTSATNVTITGAPPTGAAGGDLTGTFPNPTVAISAITSTKILDATIVDADISTTAGIVDSKLATISTPGKVSGNAITSGTIGGSTSINSTGTIAVNFNAVGTPVSFSNSTATASSVVKAISAGTGYALEADQNGGTGSAFGAYINSATNAANSIYGYSLGTGYSVAGVAAGSGIGVYGTNQTTKYNSFGYIGAINYGVYGTNQNYAVYGLNSNTGESGWIGGGGYGVYGTGNAAGVYGTTANSGGYGVFGANTSGTNGAIGLYGTSASTGGYGVFGTNTSAGSAAGVYGTTTGLAGYGVMGIATGTRSVGVYGSGTRYSVEGVAVGTGIAVYGDGGASGTGIEGVSSGSGYGGFFSSVTGYGIYATCTTQDAGHFVGSVTITNGLSVTGGTKNFKIDHPLDPSNKYLYHASIESSEVLNLYSGTLVMNDNGEAVVTMPDWFEELNKDFRYQLTCIGGFAQVYIAEEIKENRFKIAGGKAGLKVSWQITAVRNDVYMKEHPFAAEVEKVGSERGKYLNPVEHGVSETLGINYHSEARLPGTKKN